MDVYQILLLWCQIGTLVLSGSLDWSVNALSHHCVHANRTQGVARKKNNPLLSFANNSTILYNFKMKLAATLRGSRPGMQSASVIMTSLMTS